MSSRFFSKPHNYDMVCCVRERESVARYLTPSKFNSLIALAAAITHIFHEQRARKWNGWVSIYLRKNPAQRERERRARNEPVRLCSLINVRQIWKVLNSPFSFFRLRLSHSLSSLISFFILQCQRQRERERVEATEKARWWTTKKD